MSLLSEKRSRPVEGDRVYAVRNEDAENVYLYGYGEYIGQKPSEDDLTMETPFGPQTMPKGTPNPQIKLDDGSIIWGYECWWGAEKGFSAKFGNKKVVTVSLAETRAEVARIEAESERAGKSAEAFIGTTKVGLTGAVSRVERFGKAFYVAAAFILMDEQGNVLDPKLARVES